MFMHDEATLQYTDLFDQTTPGHQFIKDEFHKIPRVVWQIDPFGHSAVHAYFLGAEVLLQVIPGSYYGNSNFHCNCGDPESLSIPELKSLAGLKRKLADEVGKCKESEFPEPFKKKPKCLPLNDLIRQGDSKLVCMQIDGSWKVKNENLSTLYKVAKELKEKFVSFKISHVLRNFNSDADAQANLAIHLADGQVQEEYVG
ncbi:unnamed protein product [Trifolium pratense]|uniref:Uncharacterized protein n=1 Tax=Trifolium pratense TaxID=57577 RepID=A0ACB0JNH2_TRIPR|nr:unnamed protein product [Trifolium pratense]